LTGNLPAHRGVYRRMFEQSLLTNPAGTRKTATFAASLTAQIAAAGVLVVAPLFYHDVLPAWHMPDAIGVLVIPPAPKPPEVETHTKARSSGLGLPGIFRPPVPIHTDYPQAGFTIVDVDAPSIAGATTLSALPIGSSSSLPRLDNTPSAPVSTAVEAPETPMQVGGNVQAAKLLKQVVPAYPQTARQLRISGTVRMLGIIGRDGTIRKLQVLSGHPLLRQAAVDAVSQWVYRPTVLNGQPVEVEAPIDVIFTLSH
jgi:protein TonB